MEGFDWESEKVVTDSEWLAIYKTISQWTSDVASTNKPDATTLPSNDFDLLKQCYPQVALRDLEIPFSVEEVGAGFPYRSMKDMLNAAIGGTLSVPGYKADAVTLEATKAKEQLKALKEKSMGKIETIYASAMTYAKNPFPDDQAKKHYQNLRSKLADFPQNPTAWTTYRANMEKEVDEMARLASKKVEHHGHHDDEHHDELSPAQEFEAKYGRSLTEMQERMSKYKSDPVSFLESSIVEKYGKNGLDVWKKSQEFSSKLSVMTDADKAATEALFSNFLKQA